MKSTNQFPKVSIVVASYNYAKFLSRRIDSLIAQTYPNIEILIIDDHSSDDSVTVLKRYESHPLITLRLRDSNIGWVRVSNEGFNSTIGEYVLFANCDDDLCKYGASISF